MDRRGDERGRGGGGGGSDGEGDSRAEDGSWHGRVADAGRVVAHAYGHAGAGLGSRAHGEPAFER